LPPAPEEESEPEPAPEALPAELPQLCRDFLAAARSCSERLPDGAEREAFSRAVDAIKDAWLDAPDRAALVS
jgi:hypothetical protein